MTPHTPRQKNLLKVIDEGGYSQVSITDFIDPDFTLLLEEGLINTYAGINACRIVHTTAAGRALAADYKETG